MPKMNKKIACCVCGVELTYVKRFDGLPCNTVCCGCCSYSKISPCPKEKQEGSFLEALARHQTKTT